MPLPQDDWGAHTGCTFSVPPSPARPPDRLLSWGGVSSTSPVSSPGRAGPPRGQTNSSASRRKWKPFGQFPSAGRPDFNILLTAIRGYASAGIQHLTRPPRPSRSRALDQVEEASRQRPGVAVALLTSSLAARDSEKSPVNVRPGIESTHNFSCYPADPAHRSACWWTATADDLWVRRLHPAPRS